MTESAEQDNVRDIEPEEVDLDLDAQEEAFQREGAAEPTTVRLSGTVIHVTHAGEWSSTAMRAASSGDWDTWALEVIQDAAEYRVWVEADLKNRQIEAVFEECARQAKMSQGKSRRRSGSRRTGRTR
jgi:anti-sigma factor RsiW